jgi:hypothetical protein
MQTGLHTERDATAGTRATGAPGTRGDQMKMTVFGATGRVGEHVLRQALAAGHRVTAVVRDPARFDVSHRARGGNGAGPDRLRGASRRAGGQRRRDLGSRPARPQGRPGRVEHDTRNAARDGGEWRAALRGGERGAGRPGAGGRELCQPPDLAALYQCLRASTRRTRQRMPDRRRGAEVRCSWAPGRLLLSSIRLLDSSKRAGRPRCRFPGRAPVSAPPAEQAAGFPQEHQRRCGLGTLPQRLAEEEPGAVRVLLMELVPRGYDTSDDAGSRSPKESSRGDLQLAKSREAPTVL